jgi:hypothetical protein
MSIIEQGDIQFVKVLEPRRFDRSRVRSVGVIPQRTPKPFIEQLDHALGRRNRYTGKESDP